MFEGKELEGKIGDNGKYSVDVKPDITVEGEAEASYKLSDYFSIAGSVKLTADPLKALADLVKDSKSEFVKGAVDTLMKMVRPAAQP